MPINQSYHPYWLESYHIGQYCLFCGLKTSETMIYQYKGIGLYKENFPIPVHQCCYWQNRRLPWVHFGFVFVAILWGLIQLEIAFLCRFNVLLFPVWLMFIDLFIALSGGAVMMIRSFYKFEDRIMQYKNSHTDHEDYYQSDRWKWKR